jgi:hypothetical protein
LNEGDVKYKEYESSSDDDDVARRRFIRKNIEAHVREFEAHTRRWKFVAHRRGYRSSLEDHGKSLDNICYIMAENLRAPIGKDGKLQKINY